MAGALSRSPLPSLQTMVVTSIANDLLHMIQVSWESDPSIQQVIKRAELLKYCHNEPLGGHSGVEDTYKRMKAMFYWKGIKRSVKEHVRVCHTCQCHKPDLAPYPVYRHKPPTHVTYMAGDSHVEVVDRSLVEREAAISLLQFHLGRAQQRMKMFANKNRSDRSFMVLAKCGEVAYKLSLPDNVVIHGVFHVSQLKPFKGKPANPIPLPQCNKEGQITAVLVVVLDKKIAKVKNAVVVYWLVQWSNGNVDDATWEVANDLQARYPGFGIDS
ncbi:retrotransposable element Tf2 [Tanacetum coccineum]